MNDHAKPEAIHSNSDPITGEPGAHPVGTTIGATSGAIAGMAAGVIVGPAGVAFGGIVGAVLGGLAGKGAGEEWNPTDDDLLWQQAHARERILGSQFTFDDYSPAYRAGYIHRSSNPGRAWDEAEPELNLDWNRIRGGSRLHWDEARHAARAAWERADAASSDIALNNTF